MKEAIVYGLLDPRDGALCYVGVTRRTLAARMLSHHSYDKSKSEPRNLFVRDMLSLGLRVEGIELERVPAGEWAEAEEFWIGYHRMLGCQLLNVGPGGKRTGPPRLSDSAKAKIGAASRGKPRTAEVRAKISAAQVGRTMAADHRAKLSAAGLGKPLSQERCCRISSGAKPPARQASLSKRNTSGFRGVSFNKTYRKWKATICDGPKNRHLGFHDSAEEAARAYDTAARRLFGADAALNFPLSGERSAHREA